jgi:phosphoenolpyruvate-protein phosphotransferase
MKELSGIGASPGVVLGRARVWNTYAMGDRLEPRAAGTPQEEWQRLEMALAALLEQLGARAAGNNTSAELFAAHADILNDPSLVEMLQEYIHQDKIDAVGAVESTFGEFVALFSALDDPLFAARANDVRDLQTQLLTLLAHRTDDMQGTAEQFPAGTILLASDLMPSEVARLDAAHVAGIALAHGSRLAHAAILARSMGIPMVCQLGDTLFADAVGQECLLDGDDGRLVLDPDEGAALPANTPTGDLTTHAANGVAHRVMGEQQTRDGFTLAVLANLNTQNELEQIVGFGADGVGLLRTEFFFAREREAPSIAAQAEHYGRILQTLGDAPLYVRAFDFGGDKHMAWRTSPSEPGDTDLRGVRFLLAHPDMLRNQYLALLRTVAEAARGEVGLRSKVRYLLPMVALPEEVDIVRAFLDEAAAAEGLIDSSQAIEVGAMIEIPSAALMAGEIAARCEMISIGSNDLAQFLFAGDRSQRDAAAIADALHPAVLRIIEQICLSATAHNRPISLCGEMAGNPLATPLLLGLGITELSVTPSAVPVVKAAIGRYTLEECRALGRKALAAPDFATVRGLLIDFAA